MRNYSPCLDCSDRQLGCHATCERYMAFKNQSDEFKQLVSDIKAKEDLAISYEVNDMRKKKKRRGIK